MGPRRQPSSIDRLPSEIREVIGALRQDGRTIDEILAKLQELKVEVSRSALGRHVQTLAQVGERMRRSRDLAQSLTARFGDQPDNRLARMNLELLHNALFETLIAADSSEGEGDEDDEEADGRAPIAMDPKSLKALADALRSMASAEKLDAERITRMKAEARREALEEAAKAVDKAAKKVSGGMTKDTIQAIKSEILGVGR